ncbi:sugar phosphate isomerase/epimerase family protein [Paenibacillus farraposensis]|uniref:Sugar phosphate isomerase/epimerase family protein n=1 Tax=Paenibacillus farraposensis TaxID=2807095 RepID=A0ABW4DKC5_9BACL|nr:TIM barrel protein [Paenibacillus farraposensis]MCC3380490.1 sugar phosphate isomerase/epimerase [Paenibacillus farraposensis]
MKAVFVPTSVFGNTPGLQHEWTPTVRAAGADGIEIRRELFPPSKLPLADCCEANRNSGLRCVYSVPMELWDESGRLNETQLSEILEEAAILRPEMLKVSLGHFMAAAEADTEENVTEAPGVRKASEGQASRSSDEQLTRLGGLLDQYRVLHGQLTLLIENDQTPHGGNAGNLKAFFQTVERSGLDGVRMTFDTGNWMYAGEEPVKAALDLAPYTAYIHFKHVVYSDDNTLQTVPIPQEEDAFWRVLLAYLPERAFRAIEFTIPGPDSLSGYLKMLRQAQGMPEKGRKERD